MSSALSLEKVSIEKLDGGNYYLWKHKMSLLLVAQDLFGVVDGTEARQDENKVEWNKKDSRARATICLCLKDSVFNMVTECKNAKEVWDKLTKYYQSTSLVNQLMQRRKFLTVKMSEGEDIKEHINKVKTLAEQLQATGGELKSEDLVTTLLLSLPPSYDSLITAFDVVSSTQLTWDFVVTTILNNARRQGAPATASSETQSGNNETAFIGFNNNNRRNQQSDGNKNSKRGECFYCHQEGHFRRDCPELRKKNKGNSGNNNNRNNNGGFNQFERANQVSTDVKEDKEEVEFMLMSTTSDSSTLSCVTTDSWFVDSGATDHMSGDRNAFSDLQEIEPKPVLMGDNSKQEATSRGSVRMDLQVNGKTIRVKFTKVLFVPNLRTNLISVSRLVRDGFQVSFSSDGCAVSKGDQAIAEGVYRDRLYHLSGKVVTPPPTSRALVGAISTHSAKVQLWHQRLGHLSESSMQNLIKSYAVHGMNLSPNEVSLSLCEGCIQGKQHRAEFPSSSTSKASELLELVHSDICGPMRSPSLSGSLYFITFIDDHSGYIKLYIIRHKSEAYEKFLHYKRMSERQLGCKMKRFRTDNGTEYLSKEFKQELADSGIIHETSTSYTPQQNGVAERSNRTLVESARAMLHAQQLDHSFWAEAVSTAAYIRNRVVSRSASVKGKCPLELWTGRKPTVNHLRVFGCVAYALIPKQLRTKLEPRSIKCIFIGYAETTKAWRLWDCAKEKLIISRDVVFDEQASANRNPLSTHSKQSDSEQSSFKLSSGNKDEKQLEEKKHVDIEEHNNSNDDDDESVEEEQLEDGDPTDDSEDDSVPQPINAQQPNVVPSTLASTRPVRVRQAPVDFWNFRSATQYKRNIDRANMALTDSTLGEEPQTLAEAQSSPEAKEWMKAVEEEYQSLLKNETWKLCQLPKGRKAVGSKWVFKRKFDANGNIERYKARLVAKGFTQSAGIDYHEIFAPVVKMTSIRVLLTIVAIYNLELHQMDVKTAFLNGILEEEVYMKQPEGFIKNGEEDLVCCLVKAIYGLKQAPRAWYNRIDKFFAELNFKRIENDYGLYVIWNDKNICIIALYVDDLLIACNNTDFLNMVKAKLNKEFDMKDLKDASYILGIKIERDRNAHAIYLNQSNYLEAVLTKFSMQDCKTVSTPMDPGVKLTQEIIPSTTSIEELQAIPYQSAVGSLMYAMTCTRPDLAYAVSVVSRYCSNYGPNHWIAVKRILRYIKGTIKYRLQLGGTRIVLSGYCDADWAGDLDSRRSTTGYAFVLGKGIVSWSSKRQSVVALSTAEAEYMAATHAVKEAIWLRELLKNLLPTYGDEKAPVEISSDNQGCIAMSKNPAFHSRSKHIHIRYHFIREKVEANEIELKYCPTNEMIADVLTKPLSRDKHMWCLNALGLIE